MASPTTKFRFLTTEKASTSPIMFEDDRERLGLEAVDTPLSACRGLQYAVRFQTGISLQLNAGRTGNEENFAWFS
jgi:hypothetical protein